MNPLVPVVLGLAGAVISGFVAYIVSKRQRSGRIDTTEAGTLWAEGQAMRHELRDENVLLRAEVIALGAEVTACRVDALALKTKVEMLEDQVRMLGGLIRGEILAIDDGTLHLPEEKGL